jgi:hypothetical protein
MNGPATVVSQDQCGNYPGLWQNQDDSPWSPIDAFYSQTTVLTQRPHLSPCPEEVLYGPAGGLPGQNLNLSSVYPSQISSPLSNASWPSGEIPPMSSTLQCPDILHADEYLLNSGPMFSEDQTLSGAQAQDQRDDENSQLLPLIFNRQSPPSNQPWSHGGTSRSFPFMPRDSTFSDWFTPPNPRFSNDMSQIINNFSLNPQPNTLEKDTQLMSKCEEAIPTAPSDCKWDNTIVCAGSIQKLDGQTTSKGSNKKDKGHRIGPLAAEAARKAAQVRNAGACWRCWILHYPVS